MHLLKELETLKKRVNDTKVMLFLDYDGTITPITTKPDRALLSQKAKNVISALSLTRQFQLIIISGRGLADVTRMVGVKDIIYVGNHGFEIKGPDFQFNTTVSSEYQAVLLHLKELLTTSLSAFSGSFIEDKGMTLSIHYRLINEDFDDEIEQMIYLITKPYVDRNVIRLTSGKKVIEIRPVIDWDKGKAVEWILAKRPGIPIYIGDDTTDEDAFRAIRHSGITVYVGPHHQKASHAEYYLNNTDEVIMLLEYLCEEKCDDNNKKS
jgi:trehalose 6-phosphate phosphatase